MKTGKIKLNNHIKGILCIIAAAIGFSLMTFCVRLAGDIPTMQKAFFRNAVSLVIAFFMLLRAGEGFSIKKEYRSDIFYRCLFGCTGMVANFYAIDRIAIADANMLNKLSPFFAILLSIPILKEKPAKRDIIATIIAFVGAAFIVRPTSGIASVPALWGVYGGFGAGLAYVFVRRVSAKGAKTSTIVLCFSAFSCLITLPFFIFNPAPMSLRQIIIMVLAGTFASMGQFGITSAYKFAPAKEISVFDYTQVLFAALWGILFLDEVPSYMSIIGYVVIIGTAVWRWYYNLKHS